MRRIAAVLFLGLLLVFNPPFLLGSPIPALRPQFLPALPYNLHFPRQPDFMTGPKSAANKNLRSWSIVFQEVIYDHDLISQENSLWI